MTCSTGVSDQIAEVEHDQHDHDGPGIDTRSHAGGELAHDQVSVEALTEVAGEVKAVLEKTLIEGMERYVPDVPFVVEASLKQT